MRSYPSLIGQRFGSLVVQEQLPSTAKGQRRWLCRCDCGNSYISTTDNLKRRPMANCGCRKSPDLTGQVFGKLTVLGRSEKRGSRGARTTPMWECRCECGAITCKATDTLKNPDQSMCKDCADQRHAKAARDGAIVGGMNGQTQNSFSGKTVKLIADINLGDKESENNPDLIFYPIGYWNSEGTYEKTGTAISSGFYAFQGTFDGNGNTISNFYQNTWEMKGDHDWYDATLQYFRDGMGLFGKVLGGTIKNLTVDNFSCDSEIGTTGVIAAYADSKDGKPAVFENITITNCNPRVYNIGNGGIVGIGGNSNDPDTYKLTFTNITIDNTNKITALWGSWDVACGGLVGMFRGAGHVYMTNCHVGAQIDVYNDVCGNYQYYWYRYSGMMVGTNKNMTTDANGYTVPETDKFHAENCTVHFGDWNDYYYCELVANSLASYTYDHQFSRLTLIKSLDEIKSGDTWTKAGNFLLIDGDTKTCYHIVKNSDGTLKQHLHTDAGYEDSIDEDGDGNVDLKEDKQIVYLPFNQLFTGYGWGVKHVPIYDDGTRIDGIDITILDRTEANSVPKYESLGETEFSNGVAIKASNIVKYLNKCGVAEFHKAFHIGVTDLDSTDGTVTAVFNRAETWEDSTITFIGTGKVQITIQDYYFCTPTTITVEIKDREPAEKFDIVMNNGDFLHRVGNSGTVALDKLFKAKDGVTVGTISVTVEAVDGTGASGTYSNNAIQFSGTGVVKVTIKDDDNYCTPTELYLEVVDAANVTELSGTITGNVVLLNDCGLSSLTVSGRNTVYGNGFTATYTGNGQYLNNGLKQGVITVSENGTLDNLRIKASIYPASYLYYDEVKKGPSSVEGEKTRYHYQLSAVAASGDATISNCYIYGGRNNIFVNTGNVTIKDTILECGTLANVQIQSTSEYTVTLENVTTIQYRVNPTIGDAKQVMLGAGILVGPDTNDNPTIVLNGEFKQYNWVTAADKSAVTNSTAQTIIQTALDATAFNHTINGAIASNLGIIYMNTYETTVTNNTGLRYKFGEVSMMGQSGKVYSLQNATESQIYSDYANADRTTVNGDYLPTFDFDLGDQEISYDGSEDTRYLYGDANGVAALYQDGNEALTLDLTKLATICKYSGKQYTVTAICKDSAGNKLTATNGVITLSAQGSYTLVFTVNDNLFYDANGKEIDKSVTREFTVPLELTVKEASIKNAVVNITKTALDGVYNTVNLNDYELRIKFLDCISVTDFDNKGTGTTVNLSSNISSATLTPSGVNVFTTAFTVTITYTDGRVLTVNFSKISGSSPGTKTGKVNTSGSVYFTTEGALNNKPTEASSQNKCTITSVSFKGNNGSTVTNDTDITVTWALGSSGGGCVTPDTLVSMADGTQKRVDELTFGDKILTWDFFTGSYVEKDISLLVNHGEGVYAIANLEFSDGTLLRIIGDHGVFDYDLNKYVYITVDNMHEYIGHRFVQYAADDSYNIVTLTNAYETEEYTSAWSITSVGNSNAFASGLLTVAPPEDFYNWIEMGDKLMYDVEQFQKDVETYGLYTYEDFADYVTYQQFVDWNGAYLKVAVEKGYFSFEYILELIELYKGWMPNNA